MHNLTKALDAGDPEGVAEWLLLRVARICNPRGIMRQDFIRDEIETKYAEYGLGDLKSDVSEKTDGALKELLMALLSDRLDYDAQILEKAMKGFGTDEDVLITILCTLDEEDIFPLQAAYSDRYERSLEQAVLSETSGKFKRVLLLAGCDDIAEAYAKVCHSAISGMGTDEKALIRLMVTCSHEVMRDTRDAYARLYDTDLVDAMSGEWAVGGDFKNILCALAKKHPANVILGEYDYEPDVSALRDAVEGLGTDEAALIDVLANKTPEQIAVQNGASSLAAALAVARRTPSKPSTKHSPKPSPASKPTSPGMPMSPALSARSAKSVDSVLSDAAAERRLQEGEGVPGALYEGLLHLLDKKIKDWVETYYAIVPMLTDKKGTGHGDFAYMLHSASSKTEAVAGRWLDKINLHGAQVTILQGTVFTLKNSPEVGKSRVFRLSADTLNDVRGWFSAFEGIDGVTVAWENGECVLFSGCWLSSIVCMHASRGRQCIERARAREYVYSYGY